MHDDLQPGSDFHGIFEKLRQLDISNKAAGDIYQESESNFWHDYCGEDLSDVLHFKRELSRPGQSVLDLACGAGRIAIALAREGAVVEGLELSAAMLQLAAKASAEEPKEVRERLQFSRGDMSDFRLARRFERIVLGATSICLLLERRQRAGLFACVREHLAEGGRFLFNVLDGDPEGGPQREEFMDVYSRSTPEGQDFAIVGQRRDPSTGHYLFNVYRECIAWNGDTTRSLGASVKARIDRDELLDLIAQTGLRLDGEFRDGGVTYYSVVRATESTANRSH